VNRLTSDEIRVIRWLVERFESVEWTTGTVADQFSDPVLLTYLATSPGDPSIGSKRHFCREDGLPYCGARIPEDALYVHRLQPQCCRALLAEAYCRNCTRALDGRLKVTELVRRKRKW